MNPPQPLSYYHFVPLFFLFQRNKRCVSPRDKGAYFFLVNTSFSKIFIFNDHIIYDIYTFIHSFIWWHTWCITRFRHKFAQTLPHEPQGSIPFVLDIVWKSASISTIATSILCYPDWVTNVGHGYVSKGWTRHFSNFRTRGSCPENGHGCRTHF